MISLMTKVINMVMDMRPAAGEVRPFGMKKALKMSLGRMEMSLKLMPCLAVTTMRRTTSSQTSRA